MKRRIGSLLLALAMCLSLLPAAAFAQQVEPAEQPLPQEQLEQVAPTPEQPEESEQPEEPEQPEQPEEPEQPEQPEENEPAEQPIQPEPAQQALENPAAPLAADVDVAGHTNHDNWTKINSKEELTAITEAGNYYLTDNITLSATWEPANGVVLCLNGKNITGPSNAAVIEVRSGVTFTLTDCSGNGKITHKDNEKGRGVHVGGTFNMYGGQIADNNAGAYVGGGVYVDNNGTFTMSNGSITGNKTDYGGGGVYVNRGRFEMSGSASITGNEVSGLYSGGGVYVNGSFEMSGGSITGNKAIGTNGVGGGVYVESGTFTMSGGTIGGTGNAANTAALSGGGVYVYGGTFTMSGGSITGNWTNGSGGGVYVNNYSTFEMHDNASITGNSAKSRGGGVHVGWNGVFRMYGGSITGNNVENNSGNNVENNSGGGVNLAGGKVAVSGSANITGNVKGGSKSNGIYTGGTANNVCLNVDATITIGDSGLDSAARIGVANAPTVGKPIKIATNAKADLSVYKDIFTPDVTDKNYEITQTGTDLYLSTHQHSWTYALKTGTTDTITATCKNCPQNSGSNYVWGSLIIKTPGNLTYDGTAKSAVVEVGDAEPNVISPFAGYTVVYQVKTDEDTWGALPEGTAPTNAGTYKASITKGEATASVTYEITKATPTADDFTFTAPSDPIYNGSAKVVTITAKNPGMGDITVKYFKNDVKTDPKDAGTYTVKIDVADGTNYTAKTDLEVGKFTINKADYTGTPITIEKTVLWQSSYQTETVDMTGRLPVLDGVKMVTAQVGTDADHIIEKVAIIANTVEIDLSSNVAYGKTATINVTITSTNYNNITATITVNTKDKDEAAVTISGLPEIVTYGQEFTLTPTAKDGEITLSGGKWTWNYDHDYFKQVEANANTGTITLQAIQSGTGSFEVDYSSNTHRGSRIVSIEIQKKTLKQADLTGIPTKLTKVYDGTNTYIGNAVYLTLKDTSLDPNLKIGVSADQITFAQSDAGQTTAKIDLTNSVLTPNYKFANGFTEISGIPATITPATPTVSGSGTASGTYGQKLSEVTVTGLTAELNGQPVAGRWELTDTKNETLTDVTGSGSTVEYTAIFTPTDTTNFTTAEAKVAVTIAPAAGRSLGAVNLTQRYTDTAKQTFEPDWTGLPTGETWTYNSEHTETGTAQVSDSHFTADGKTLTYKISNGQAGEKVTFTLKAICASGHYENFTITVVVTLEEKNPATVTVSGLPENGVTFGDKITLTASQTGDTASTGSWTWTYDHTYFRAVGDTNAAAITLQAIQPSTQSLSITATYDSDDYRGSQSVTVTSIAKKVLHRDDLKMLRAHKVYDGTNASTEYTMTAPFTIRVAEGNFVLTLTNDDITFATVDVGDTEAYIKIPSDCPHEYYELGEDLAGQTITVDAFITPCPLEIATATAVDREYKPGDTSVEISTVTFYQQLAKSPVMGKDYTVTGTMADANVGTGKQVTVTLTVLNKNFTESDTGATCTTTVNITPAPAPTLPDINLSHKYTLTGSQTAQLPALTDGAAYTLGAATGDTAILSAYSVQDDVLTYTLSGTGAAGDTVTLPVTITSPNYADTIVHVVITLTAKDVPAVAANDITLTYTGSAIPASAITGAADVAGAWSWKSTPPQNVADSGAHTVVFTPANTADYAPVEVTITVTINPAAATGAPKYTKITSGGKTLADAALTADGSTLNPSAGTLEWLDDAGSVLPGTTAVEANKTYTWRFTPDGGNHTVLTGAVELYHVASSSGSRRTTPTVDVSKLPLLSNGSTGEYVKWLQQRLNALGYDCGSADGIFGSKTYAAVTAFQKASGLSADGVVGPLTWTRLDMGAILPADTTLDAALPLLRTGSTGQYVKRLQQRLNALGYDCGDADGIFGSRTHAAVIAFQKANGLSADGIAGPLTWAKLG